MTCVKPVDPSNTFCILPWTHLAVMPGGAARVCCLGTQDIEVDGVSASLQTHSLDAIWNSPHMVQLRRRMMEGKHVSDCATCYLAEKQGMPSYRIQSNDQWWKYLGADYLTRVHESAAKDYAVSGLPMSFQLMVGNNCNLKCRMCFPTYSSKIANDAVHAAWTQEDTPTVVPKAKRLAALDWSRGHVPVLPHASSEVSVEGLHTAEMFDNQPLRWTDGNAVLKVALPAGVHANAVTVKLWGFHPNGHRLRVLINEQLVHDETMACASFARTFPIPAGDGPSISIRLLSDTYIGTGDTRLLGVAVQTVELQHTVAARARQQATAAQRQPLALITETSSAAAGSRLPDGPWHHDDAWIREVLLPHARQLREMYFTGGEPMIEKQVERTIDYLIEKGVAKNILLRINTNATVMPDRMLQKLLQFQKVNFALSLDAYGAYHEYIRYPAKWSTIQENVERLRKVAGEKIYILAGPMLQTYNVLNLTQVLEFFDAHEIFYQVSFIRMPWFLNVDVLPARIRKIAADRLKAYVTRGCPAIQKDHVLSLAHHIETVKTCRDPQALTTFMRFTNDLDAGRGQDFRKVHAELVDLLRAEGFTWTSERQLAA